MKRIIVTILTLIAFIPNIYAEEVEVVDERVEASLIKCDKTDSIFLEIDGKTKIVSLLAYDSSDGSLNNEISKYACELLKNSNNIKVEYDSEFNNKKYNKDAVWLFVDDKLLQEELISKGYGQVNYVYGNYKYTNSLCDIQKQSISSSLGIWNYEGIKEEFCNSGIKIGDKIKETKEEKKVDNDKLIQTLKYMIFLSSGILLLSLLLFKRRK